MPPHPRPARAAIAGVWFAARYSRLFLLAEATELREEHFLQLLETFESCRQPGFQHCLRVHCLQRGAQALLDFRQQGLLQRFHIRQAKKHARLLRRAFDVDIEFHRTCSSCFSDFGPIAAKKHPVTKFRVISTTCPSKSRSAATSHSNMAGSNRWRR